MEISKKPAITTLRNQLFTEKNISLSVLRLDEIHHHISGNKWYKLKYNVEEFFRLKKKYLVTFGGAFSNHIIATAAAGKEMGIHTIGIIRGDELNENSNGALKFASQSGMKLFFVSRIDYRKILDADNLEIENELLKSIPGFSDFGIQYSDLFFLPEGGSNSLAVKGCAEIVNSIPEGFNFICCACGTGATLAGISTALNENHTAIGISVLHGEKFLEKDILKLNGNKNNFQLLHEYSFGGYAKSNAELDSFCEQFMLMHAFKIEPVYTGKMFFGLYDLISKDYFAKGTRIIALHTGGVHFFQV
ncbi:MAG: pyridoxal-phosphate dependent enzyme [Bacteroidota bacterium]